MTRTDFCADVGLAKKYYRHRHQCFPKDKKRVFNLMNNKVKSSSSHLDCDSLLHLAPSWVVSVGPHKQLLLVSSKPIQFLA